MWLYAARCSIQYVRQSNLPTSTRNVLSISTAYTDAQLTAAVNDTASVPPLTLAQLSQTLFHCTDTLGTITANAYCFAGCDVKAGTRNSQCIL